MLLLQNAFIHVGVMTLTPFVAVAWSVAALLVLRGLLALVPALQTDVLLVVLLCVLVGEIGNHLVDLILKAAHLALCLGDCLRHLFIF